MKRHLLLMLAVVGLSGCISDPFPNNAVSVKTTVFGMVVGADPSAGNTPTLKLGLVRTYITKLPTSTNRVYVAPFESRTDADLHLTTQNVTETVSTVSTNSP